MKDSRTYGQKIGKLFCSLRQKYANVKRIEFGDPAYARVYAIISERTRTSTAKTIVRRMERHFVDLNDLRVARTEEILDMLGAWGEDSRKTASVLTQVLNSIYNRYNMVSLTALKEVGKRRARKQIEKLDGLSRFALNYCVLTALRGHSIPLTRKMIEYLKAGELVHPDATDDEIEGFLERQIAAANAYEFYSLLRQESEKAKRARAAAKKVKKADKKTQ
jgi:endonuclease III